MKPRLRNTAALLGVTGMVALAGCGSDPASQADATNGQAADAASGQPQQPGQAPSLDALAAKLGVSTEKLQRAIEATRSDAGSAGQPPSTDPAAALADELGLSEAKVRAAMEALGPAGGPPAGGRQGAPPSGSAPAQSGAGNTTA